MADTKIIYVRDESGDWDISVPKRATKKQIEKYIEEHVAEYFTDHKSTIWVNGRWGLSSDHREHTFDFALDPVAPQCSRKKHYWHSPHSIVGGIEENPGVWGHGGGVIILEVCKHCGVRKRTDTWAQNPLNGQQGLNSIRYDQDEGDEP